MLRTTSRRTVAILAAAILVGGVGCSSDDGTSDARDGKGGGSEASSLIATKNDLMPKLASEVGEGEGSVDILARSGYAEAGVNDPDVDWVSDYEEQTGCRANVTEFRSSDEARDLIAQGGWDVVSAPGDEALRLVAAREVAPVNTALLPNYDDVFPYLKARPWNSVDGQMFGIPHSWGASVLQYRTDIVDPAPAGWGAVFDPSSPYRGKIAAHDSPMSIADAALHLMSTRPELGVEDPFALDAEQFDAAVAVLEEQRPLVGEYWSDRADLEEAFTAGSVVLGTSRQSVTSSLQSADPPVPVAVVDTTEGSTGWSDTWMVAVDSAHANCAYMWLDWIISPDTNAQAAEWIGEAPANEVACELTTDPDHCATFRATDLAYAEAIHFWTTPMSVCLDGRTDVTCKDDDDWSTAWDEIRG